jgi:hypothetical protein
MDDVARDLLSALTDGRCPDCGFAWEGHAWTMLDREAGAVRPDPTVPGSQVPCETCWELRKTLPEDDRPLDVEIRPVRREDFGL